jgi:DNA topoisomerase-1
MSEVNAIHIGRDSGAGASEGAEIVVRVWNTGESLHKGDEKCPLPADLAPDELTIEKAKELLERGSGGPRELGADPETGETVLVLTGRFGPFVQLGVLEDGSKKTKPPRASLFDSMDPDTIDLETALELLSLPRVVGADAEGNEITAQNGRYGPYLKKGTDSRSLDSEEQLFTVTLEEALAIFARPKLRRGQRAKPPIAELGANPDNGAPVRVLDGRFGPYVTDGTTNATVPRGMDPAAITLEEGVELLRERAARGPAKKKTAKKRATAKKATKKRATKKKATTKKATKKATKKKATKKATAKKAVATKTPTMETAQKVAEPGP